MRRTSLRPLLWVLAVTGLVWAVVFVVRVQAHQPNVDDYLYADRAAGLLRDGPLGYVKGVLRSGSVAPLVPALAAPLARWGGVDQAVLVQLPLLLLLAGGAYAVARTWVGPAPAAVVAGVAALNQAVLAWSVMLHFGVVSTAAVLWSFATYLHSDRLRRTPWSVGFGLSVAVLALSRSVAPVYVVPLLLVVLVDVLRDRWARRPLDVRPVLAAAVVALLCAGPWWWFSGPTAMAYLRGAGYEAGSDLSGGGLALGVDDVARRLVWTVTDLGGVQTTALTLALGATVALVVAGRVRLPGSLPLVVWAVLTHLLLSTSGNVGTGFGLPVLVFVLVLVATGLALLLVTSTGPVPGGVATAGVLSCLVLAAVGVAAHVGGGRGFWWTAAPYRVMVLEAGGTADTDVASTHREVAGLVGDEVALLTRDDALLNGPGLGWHGTRLAYLPFGADATDRAVAELPRVTWLLAGEGPGLYHASLDQQAVEAVAEQQGFELVRTERLGHRNVLRVWRRDEGAVQRP